ncbi:LRR receptor-like serine/threonine-protein kinase GSO2 [Vigna radiata var. radiata]|uniref:LRR receptor-like serine/threonine-protein kinase GSO2 n=1 Tax=Vigna radiata var. radiata TaxID=3916 RepID=A0A1S3V1Q2_VIGRR|nr:LRR receptor-like serine/threonine-protein kinase GSO2 [Vigna radiata var. radiata]
MESYFQKILFAAFVCLLYTKLSVHGFNPPLQSSHVKCIERERQALLTFKQSVRDYHGMLSTWRDDENNRDCCKWEAIECNNQTGHIEMLDLRGSTWHYLSGSINITSLFELKKLEYLDLSFHDFFKSQIPVSIGSFQSLRYLNLSLSGLLVTIPYELRNLSKLEYLDLKSNGLAGEVPSQLGNLSNLGYLDLSGNSFSGTIPHELGNLSHMMYLDLSGNSLSGTLPFQVGNLQLLHSLRLDGSFGLKIKDEHWLSSLSSLTTLSLYSFPSLDFSHPWLQIISHHLPNLRKLSLVRCGLSDYHISSLFPSQFNISTSLSILDLSYNILTSSTFQLLSNYSPNLQELHISDNNIVLSSSHYANFPSLVVLDLSSNNLTQVSLFQWNFNFSTKLQNLYLGNCGLTDKNFHVSSTSIKDSHYLVTLNLSLNMLTSAIFDWVFNITTNLQSLSLSDNLIEGPIPDAFGKVMNSLEVLIVETNKLKGEIPASLGNICTLKELYLNSNSLSGKISSFIQNSSRCNSPALEMLDLSNNSIIGKIPNNISTFKSLRYLYLSNNQLTGEIPESIGLLYKLQSLHLEENYLEGDINELHLTNLSQLVDLDLSDNSLSLTFGTTWFPSFQIFIMALASCNLGPSFPSWLQNQSQLVFLDISDAGIDDFVPDWFWNNLQFINEINMSYNSLKGSIPNLTMEFLSDGPNAIILNSNNLEGVIPTFLSYARTLDLSGNKFSDLNTLLCRNRVTKGIHTLDLSNNQITGQLPECWEHLSSLAFLDLRNNKLSGKIPQSMGTLVQLEALVLRNNNFNGELPLTLKKCSNLALLDVSKNLLSGSVPSWIGENMQQLKILSLRVNNFFGSVPVQLFYLSQIQVFDLSKNNLSGEIPTCFTNFTTLMERSVIPREIVRKRKISTQESYGDIYDSYLLLAWKGQDHEFWNPENLLKSIDLSCNSLTGKIPKEIGYLVGLISLNLSRNNFHGEIPTEIGNLSLLEFLDFSRNNLSGSIPSTLSNIDRLGVLDLSNNNLSGRIPWGRQLQTFDASSFEGNVDLCGEQLNKSCPGDKTQNPKEPAIGGEEDNSIFYGGFYMSLEVGFFVGFWGLLGPMLIWQPWRIAYMRFLNRLIDYILVMVELNINKYHKQFKG